jgi:hypothetical protein
VTRARRGRSDDRRPVGFYRETGREAVAVNWIERLSEGMDRQKAIAIVLVALMVGSMIAGVALI